MDRYVFLTEVLRLTPAEAREVMRMHNAKDASARPRTSAGPKYAKPTLPGAKRQVRSLPGQQPLFD